MNDRFIGIDFGLSKVGLSISDPLKIISIPLKVIKYKNREMPISNGDINLYIPPEKCCVYINEKLI